MGEPGNWAVLGVCFAAIAAGCLASAPFCALLDRLWVRKENR